MKHEDKRAPNAAGKTPPQLEPVAGREKVREEHVAMASGDIVEGQVGKLRVLVAPAVG
jgi:hypothetical protein